MQVAFQQLGVVVGHLLEVGHVPALVHRITVEAARQLVVHAAAGHAVERGADDGEQVRLAAGLVLLQQQLQGRRMGKLGRAAEAAIADVKELGGRFDNRVHHLGGVIAAGTCKQLRPAESIRQFLGILFNLLPARFEIGGDAGQDTLKAGPTVEIIRGKVGAAKKRLALRSEECGQGPAALAADGADGGLVAGVDVGALVAVHFDGNKILVDELGDFLVLVAFPIHHVAPVAPDRANVEQDGLVLLLRPLQCLGPPGMPGDRLVRSALQIGAGLAVEPIWFVLSHDTP